jgi:hypothetical protein
VGLWLLAACPSPGHAGYRPHFSTTINHQRASLSSFIMFGERKGMMTGIVAPHLRKPPVEYLAEQLQNVCNGMAHGDWWSTQVGSLTDSRGIINDDDAKVLLHLSNINMLWDLGLKKVKHPLSEADQEAERTRMMDAIFKQIQ